MSRGPGRVQRMILELLEEAGGSLPVGKLYRELSLKGADRSNVRRALKGLLESGALRETEEEGLLGRNRCIRAAPREAPLTDVIGAWWERFGRREHELQAREEQEGAPATPCVGGDPKASSAPGEAEPKRQRGTPHVVPDAHVRGSSLGEGTLNDNVLRLLEEHEPRGSP